MRVSSIFAQGGHYGHGDDCGYDCYGCDDYYSFRGDFYRNGYRQHRCDDECGFDRGDRGGLLGGLL